MTWIKPTAPGVFPVVERNTVHHVCLGNGTALRIGVFTAARGELWFGVETYGTRAGGFYSFNHFAHAGYVDEKLRVGSGDAANLADFINTQINGCALQEGDAQGHYDADLCHA